MADSVETLSSNAEVLLMNYEPQTNIIDHSRIDLDQKEIEKELAQKRFLNALNIYEKGAYSGAYAALTVAPQELNGQVAKGTPVNAIAVDGKKQQGNCYETVSSTATSIQVQYKTSIGCANVRDNDDPSGDISRCFSETGNIVIGSDTGLKTAKYHYDIKKDTKYSRSFQKLRIDTESTMPIASQHDHYQKFVNYYGQSDYANQWILAAFNSTDTNFDNGNANFGLYSEEGRIQAITKGNRYMSILMHVIDEMEGAIYDCFSRCSILGCSNNRGTSSWDKAVAFYVGSQEDGNGGGYMPYALANEECQDFGTCDTATAAGQQAKVNVYIMDQFNHGKAKLMSGKCFEAKQSKEHIIQLTTVPLVQGTLRRAYYDEVGRNHEDQNTARIEMNRAEGTVFAASILPTIHACNKKDAHTIHRNMKESAENGLKPSYTDVKMAFENNYECLGITCEEVGGLVDITAHGQYLYGAQPCSIVEDNNDNMGGMTSNIYRITPFTSAFVILVVVLMLFIFRIIIFTKGKGAATVANSPNSENSNIKRDSIQNEHPIDNNLNSSGAMDDIETTYSDENSNLS